MKLFLAELQNSMKHEGTCVQSGYCCTQRPCQYGISKPGQQECLYLAPPTADTGQRYCEIATVIRFLEQYEKYPMLGSGCSSTLFNQARNRVIKKLNTKTP